MKLPCVIDNQAHVLAEISKGLATDATVYFTMTRFFT